MSDGIKETVLSVYDTVADPSLWPDLLQRIADEIDAVGCIIFEWTDTQSDRRLHASHTSSFYDPSSVAYYVEKFFEEESHDQDVFERHSLKSDSVDLVDDSVLTSSMAVLKSKPNVLALQKLGIFHRAAGLLNKDNTLHSRFSVQLGVSRGPLNASERHYLSSVLPHVAKALDLGKSAQQLAKTYGAVFDAIDHLVVGVCLLDARGRVMHANEEFRRQESIFRVFLTKPNGEIIFNRPQDQAQFEILKVDAMNHGQFGARPRKEAISTDLENHLCIELTPLTRSSEIGAEMTGGFILHSVDTSRPVKCSVEPIKAVFNLTETELELLELIAKGLTNAQIAVFRDRSVDTVNGQVKSILSKTNCSTRTQLIRLMMSYGATFFL